MARHIKVYINYVYNEYLPKRIVSDFDQIESTLLIEIYTCSLKVINFIEIRTHTVVTAILIQIHKEII